MEEYTLPELFSEEDSVEAVDDLKELSLNYYENKFIYSIYMKDLRLQNAIGLPMKKIANRLVVNVGNSHLMDDVYSGRCHEVHFDDLTELRNQIKRSELENLQEDL